MLDDSDGDGKIKKNKKGISFFAFTNKDFVLAFARGLASGKHIGENNLVQLMKNFQNEYSNFELNGSLKISNAVIIRNSTLKYVRLIYREGGNFPYFFDMSIMKDISNSCKIGQMVWAENIKWKLYGNYVFSRRIFTYSDPKFFSDLEKEQERDDVQTNRDGWIKSDTWGVRERKGVDRDINISHHRDDGFQPIQRFNAINF